MASSGVFGDSASRRDFGNCDNDCLFSMMSKYLRKCNEELGRDIEYR